jgi:thiazole synthase ThiGH ThiG subunit
MYEVEASDCDEDGDGDDDDEYQVHTNHRKSRKRTGKASEASQTASRQSQVLKSGFQVSTFSLPRTSTSHWSRNPPMKSIAFTRVELIRDTNGCVSFKSSTEPDTILIADDWYKGEILSRQGNPDKTLGYISSGASKRSIYVCLISKVISDS